MADTRFYPDVDLSHGHVLIIDDQDYLRQQIRSTLAEGGLFTRFIEAPDGLEGFQLLLQNLDSIDIVLCDVEMPQIDGFKFLSLKSSKPDLAEVPVIMLTTRGEDEHRIRGLELGANDYIVKPFVDGELQARAANQLQIRRLLKALRNQAEELEKLSNTDALTRTNNRRYLMQQLSSEFSRSLRYNTPLTLIIGDIDHFKEINDSYGHQSGDNVLVQVATVLHEGCRGHDVLARYGGEEFCILLPETPLEDGYIVAERYRQRIENTVFRCSENLTTSVHMSFGVASSSDNAPKSMDELLRFADIALYQAKDGGRNRTVKYEQHT